MIRADFQQGMELVSLFKMNTVTENYWLIYATAMDLISHCVNLKLALRFHALLIMMILSL